MLRRTADLESLVRTGDWGGRGLVRVGTQDTPRPPRSAHGLTRDGAGPAGLALGRSRGLRVELPTPTLPDSLRLGGTPRPTEVSQGPVGIG